MDRKRKKQTQTKKQVNFLDWLIHGKGTISEPWPTAEELFEKKKHEIAEIQETLDKLDAMRKAKK